MAKHRCIAIAEADIGKNELNKQQVARIETGGKLPVLRSKLTGKDMCSWIATRLRCNAAQ